MRREQYQAFGSYLGKAPPPNPERRLAPDQWLPLVAIARLEGVDLALVSRNARDGLYGPVRRTSGQTFVLLSGVQERCRWCWSVAQVRAAIEGRPLPPGDPINGKHYPPRRRMTVSEIAARLNADAPPFPCPTTHRSDELPDLPDDNDED